MQFELYYDDLTEEAKKNILELAKIKSPEENNWDVFPIATIEIGDDEEEE